MKLPHACDDLVPKTPEALMDPTVISAWSEFTSRYPYKKDCLDEIVSVLLASGLLFCRECKQQCWEKLAPRLLKCSDCSTKRSATAGTFFDHMRSYRAWLAAIWFAQRGITVSSTIFQKLLNIAHSSARLILKRVMTALKEPMKQEKDTLQVSTAVFMELFRRRSSETEARRAPRTEEEAFAEEPANPAQPLPEPVTAREQEPLEGGLSEEQETISRLLAQGPLSSSQISTQTGLPIPQVSACLSIMEMSGLCKRLPGNQFASATHMRGGSSRQVLATLSEAALAAVKAITQATLKKYKGISRKDLQIYLIAYWCSHRNLQSDTQTVLDACLKLGKKTSKQLFAQITPPIVQIYATQ